MYEYKQNEYSWKQKFCPDWHDSIWKWQLLSPYHGCTCAFMSFSNKEIKFLCLLTSCWYCCQRILYICSASVTILTSKFNLGDTEKKKKETARLHPYLCRHTNWNIHSYKQLHSGLMSANKQRGQKDSLKTFHTICNYNLRFRRV